MGTHPIFESDFDCLTVMRNRAPRRGRISPAEQECVGECVDDDSAGRSRNQSSSLDSSIDRDILDGRSISPLEQISTTPEMTPDRIPSVSPTPPQVPKTADQSKSRTNRWYYDGFHPMKPSLKRKLRRRKLSKELDQLVDGLDIDEEPPPSKMALSRTRFKERKKNEQKRLEKIKAKEKEDALKQIFVITE